MENKEQTDKAKREKLLIEMMKSDEESGLYNEPENKEQLSKDFLKVKLVNDFFKFLKVAHLRDLENQVSQGEITYSKMIEEINIMAYDFYFSELNKRNQEIEKRDEEIELNNQLRISDQRTKEQYIEQLESKLSNLRKEIEGMKIFGQPSFSSNNNYPHGWNEALKKVLELIDKTPAE